MKRAEFVLNDMSYEEVGGNEKNQQINKKRNSVTDNALGLTKKDINYTTDFDYRSTNFQGLAKVHKAKPVADTTEELRLEIVSR